MDGNGSVLLAAEARSTGAEAGGNRITGEAEPWAPGAVLAGGPRSDWGTGGRSDGGWRRLEEVAAPRQGCEGGRSEKGGRPWDREGTTGNQKRSWTHPVPDVGGETIRRPVDEPSQSQSSYLAEI